MIAGLAAAVPDSLAGFAARTAVGAAPGCIRAGEVARGRTAFDMLSGPLARRYPRADRRALLSYWTQHYFCALIVPALAVAARLDRVLPLALDAVAIEPDGEGAIGCLRFAHGGTAGDACAVAMTIRTLAAGHLRPFIAGCAGWSGLSPRVMWCNAGVVLDWAAGELGVVPPACLGLDPMEGAFLAPFRAAPPEARAGCSRKRRICCLRLRLPGVPSCGASCPLAA